MTDQPVLSILMPVYNERATLDAAIDHLQAVDFGVPIELVAVDDGSTDGSRDILRERAASAPWIKAVFHERNGGKGKAIRTALTHARGRLSCIYDADLEYEAADMLNLLKPILEGRAEVAYGIRAFGGHAAYSYWYVLGNKMLTTFANLTFNCYVRDIMTCFKMMPTELFRMLDIRSSGFELEAEITGKLLAYGYRIFEVPVSYKARTYEEGKKIQTSDGWGVLWTLLKLRFFHPQQPRGSKGVPDRAKALAASNGHTERVLSDARNPR